MTSSTRLRMRMADIADIARVQRPVVTMWRKRPAPSGHAFPDPVAVDGGETWFDADEVADYLAATGRGNNPSASDDIAVGAALTVAPGRVSPMRDDEFAAVSALLALRAIDDEGFADVSQEEILDRADDADPDDEFLFTELHDVGARLPTLAGYADRLVESSYSVPLAMENLMAQRFRWGLAGHRAIALSAPALDVVASLVLALADQAGMETTTVVDPTAGGSDLLVALVQRAEHRVLAVHTATAADPVSRLARRRLRAQAVDRRPFDADRTPAGSLYVARFPTPADPTMSPAEILHAVNELAVSTSPTDRVVIVAPAAVLTDRLASAQDRERRDDLLRTDRLRALVKLPVGLVPGKPRQRLALCCLGPTPDVAQADFVAIGDLPNILLEGPSADALAIDLAAVMTPIRSRQTHSARFLHLVAMSELRARRGSLVTSTPGPTLTAAVGTELALEIADLRDRLAEPVAALAVPAVETVAQPAALQPNTLGNGQLHRVVQLRPGHRIDPAAVDSVGSVRVIGKPELCDEQAPSGRMADRLRLVSLNPGAEYTEPGDIVFCAAPRPYALVDPGGAVVESPARILRLDRAVAGGLAPEVVAADINAQPSGAKNWRAWPLRRVVGGTVPAVTTALVSIGRHRGLLTERLQQLDRLRTLLIDGLTSGNLTITSEPTAAPVSVNSISTEGTTHASTH
ncbi:MAG: hypothetical protein ACR2P2_19895 [Nakamurella sp.]